MVQIFFGNAKEAVRFYMNRAGMTQAQLSRQAGIPDSNISRFLKGHRPLGPYLLDKLCWALQLGVDEALQVRSLMRISRAEQRVARVVDDPVQQRAVLNGYSEGVKMNKVETLLKISELLTDGELNLREFLAEALMIADPQPLLAIYDRIKQAGKPPAPPAHMEGKIPVPEVPTLDTATVEELQEAAAFKMCVVKGGERVNSDADILPKGKKDPKLGERILGSAPSPTIGSGIARMAQEPRKKCATLAALREIGFSHAEARVEYAKLRKEQYTWRKK